mgnify:CR=1 FL=1
MFEGDLNEGELEIGQVGSMVKAIQPVADIMDDVGSAVSRLLQLFL